MEQTIKAKQSGRGAFLWVMLVVFGIGCFLRLISILFPSALPIYTGGPSWDYSFNILAFILEMSGIIGIFLWKRWGIYLMALAYAGEVIVDFVYFSPRPSLTEGILNLIVFMVLVWAVWRKWPQFKQ